MSFDFGEISVDRHRDLMSLHLQYLLEKLNVKKRFSAIILLTYQSFDFHLEILKYHEIPSLVIPVFAASKQSLVMSYLVFLVHWATCDLVLAMESQDRDEADIDHIQQLERIQQQLSQLHDFSEFD